MEGLSNWFNDKDHVDNAKKRPFLKEIFRVAKAEESYNRGEHGKFKLLTSLVFLPVD